MKAVKQPRALATRERILEMAARLFALKGYHDTTLDDVLRAAEVTTGAFFHHFGSKEDLGFAVLDRHMERRRQALDEIEQQLPPCRADDPLGPVCRRLDAIQAMVRRRQHRRGGCVVGNLSTALSDTHDRFRRRLAECFDEMALEFKPHLDAAVLRLGQARRVDTWELARYIVAIIEGSIMLSRTQQDKQMMRGHFELLKRHLRQSLGTGSS
jgi:TetR/AcrR family transcriptional repressor of nem operon